MKSNEKRSPLDALAWAGLDETDLARGVVGTVTVDGLDAVRRTQLLFMESGWERAPHLEGISRLEHRVYQQRFGSRVLYATLTAGIMFGVFAEVEVRATRP